MTHTQIGKPYHVCNRFLYVEDRLAPACAPNTSVCVCVCESPVGAPGMGYRVSHTDTYIPSQPTYGDHNEVIHKWRFKPSQMIGMEDFTGYTDEPIHWLHFNQVCIMKYALLLLKHWKRSTIVTVWGSPLHIYCQPSWPLMAPNAILKTL